MSNNEVAAQEVTKRATNNQNLPSLLISRAEFARLIDASTATFDRLNSAGRIGPKPIRLSPGRIAWRRATVERWLEASEAVGELIGHNDWGQRDGPTERI